MPPVFGPASPSATRLKSWAGTSGTTVSPSVTQNSETSGPSRYSSTTTRCPRAWASASSRESVTMTPLPAASSSCLTTYGAPTVSSAATTSASVVQTQCPAVGTPAAVITSLANALLPSSCAAAALGPNTAKPAARRSSAAPSTSGASGPITTRSALVRVATSSGVVSGRVSAAAAMPGLPGAQTSRSTCGSRTSARHSACSRAPPPITSTRTMSPSHEPLLQAGPHREPVVDDHGEHDRVAPGAVGAAHVSPQHALTNGAELRDRGLRPRVDQVGLDLHPADPAVVERVLHEQQLAFRVDGGRPHIRCVRRPADVDPFIDQVDVAETGRADDAARLDQPDGVHDPLARHGRIDPLAPPLRCRWSGRRTAVVAGRPDAVVVQRREDALGVGVRRRVEPDVRADG